LFGLAAKFAGGALALFNGLSLGREGPSIQLGGGWAIYRREIRKDRIRRAFPRKRGRERWFGSCFQRPAFWRAIRARRVVPQFFFNCHNRLHDVRDCRRFTFEAAFRIFTDIFHFHCEYATVQALFPFIDSRVLTGLLGKLFNFLLVSFSDFYSSIKRGKTLIPTLLALLATLFYPYVLGGGHSLIEDLLKNKHTLLFLFALFSIKALLHLSLTVRALWAAFFLPMLAVGAGIGAFFFESLDGVFAIDYSCKISFILYGMVDFFTAIVKAPVTAIVLLVEMSRSVLSLLPLVNVAFTSYLFTEISHSCAIYEILLKRLLSKTSSVNMPLVKSKAKYGKTVLEIPIAQGTQFIGCLVVSIRLPIDAKIVSIIRGEEEVIIMEDTRIFESDLVILLVDAMCAHKIHEQFGKTIEAD
jgi:hypothetical protein